MPNTPAVSVNVVNNTIRPTIPMTGIHFVMGPTARGPFNDPSEIITSWAQFKRIYGGLLNSTDFPLICKRALEAGALLRVCRIGHYTDITDASTLDPTSPTKSTVGYLSIDAAFVASNTIDLDINGDAITQVPFNTDSDTTLQDIATQIEAHSSVAEATVLNIPGTTDDNRVIIVISNDPTAAVEITGIAVAGGASQPSLTWNNSLQIVNNIGQPIIDIETIGEGDGYNGIAYKLKRISGYNYVLEVFDSNDTTIAESYSLYLRLLNGTLIDFGTINGVNAQSNLVKLTNLGAAGGLDTNITNLIAVNQYDTEVASYLVNGTPGGAIVATDYVGDSAEGLGFHAFDNYDDGWTVSVPELSDNTIHIKGASYALGRKDLVYIAHIANSNKTTSAIVGAKDAITGLSNHTVTIGGGLKVLDTSTNQQVEISEVGGLLGLISQTQANQAPWYPPTGPNRGVIGDALGVVNNFGSNAQYADLNILAQEQIMMVIQRNGQIMAWGGYTQDVDNSQLQYLGTTFLVIYLRKLLKPLLESFIEEPAVVETFKRIYETVRPTLDDLQNRNAYSSYVWEGDQNATSLDDLQVNQASDVQQGKYKINFRIKPVGFLQDIQVNIILTDAGVSFE